MREAGGTGRGEVPSGVRRSTEEAMVAPLEAPRNSKTARKKMGKRAAQEAV